MATVSVAIFILLCAAVALSMLSIAAHASTYNVYSAYRITGAVGPGAILHVGNAIWHQQLPLAASGPVNISTFQGWVIAAIYKFSGASDVNATTGRIGNVTATNATEVAPPSSPQVPANVTGQIAAAQQPAAQLATEDYLYSIALAAGIVVMLAFYFTRLRKPTIERGIAQMRDRPSQATIRKGRRAMEKSGNKTDKDTAQ